MTVHTDQYIKVLEQRYNATGADMRINWKLYAKVLEAKGYIVNNVITGHHWRLLNQKK